MADDTRLDRAIRPVGEAAQADRRASPRSKLPGEVEIAAEEPHVCVKGRVIDISLTGCKVHLDAELPLDYPVSLRFSLGGVEFEMRGTVRRGTSEAGFGIEFLPADNSGSG